MHNRLNKINEYCGSKLIDLETDTLFDILFYNNIIKERNGIFLFRSSYWIFYFAAKRMSINEDFRDYIFKNKYSSFPEIIEFYTGIERNRVDALKFLTEDLKNTNLTVSKKLGLPDRMNPYDSFQWNPSEEQISNSERNRR